MDSSVSETYSEQEGTAYKGHIGCPCRDPLFCFDQFGHLERCLLCSGRLWRHCVREPVGYAVRRAEKMLAALPSGDGLASKVEGGRRPKGIRDAPMKRLESARRAFPTADRSSPGGPIPQCWRARCPTVSARRGSE